MGYSGARLAPWFDRTPTHEALEEMAHFGTDHLKHLIVAKTPVDTGNLKQSWQTTPLVVLFSGTGGRIYERSVETHVDYAPYVEHGTGIYGPKHAKYVIEPKKPGGFLHWISPQGHDVFAKRVVHQGSPGAHMVAKAVSETEAQLDSLLQPLLEMWARRVERQNNSGLFAPGGVRRW